MPVRPMTDEEKVALFGGAGAVIIPGFRKPLPTKSSEGSIEKTDSRALEQEPNINDQQVKHSPGPWRICMGLSEVRDWDDEPVAVIHQYDPTSEAPMETCALANGLLIESAPKMFQILRQLLAVAEGGFYLPVAEGQLREIADRAGEIIARIEQVSNEGRT